MNSTSLLLLILSSFSLAQSVLSIRCYQCSSDEDKTTDSCGAYESFDTNKNAPVDCMAEDAVTPGTFCYKSIQQGPRGFIWDGRWRTVIRRCAQISERGISWGCDWGFHENGVYWEECYCAEDGCNGSTGLFEAIGSHNYVMLMSTTIGIVMTIILKFPELKSASSSFSLSKLSISLSELVSDGGGPLFSDEEVSLSVLFLHIMASISVFIPLNDSLPNFRRSQN